MQVVHVIATPVLGNQILFKVTQVSIWMNLAYLRHYPRNFLHRTNIDDDRFLNTRAVSNWPRLL